MGSEDAKKYFVENKALYQNIMAKTVVNFRFPCRALPQLKELSRPYREQTADHNMFIKFPKGYINSSLELHQKLVAILGEDCITSGKILLNTDRTPRNYGFAFIQKKEKVRELL